MSSVAADGWSHKLLVQIEHWRAQQKKGNRVPPKISQFDEQVQTLQPGISDVNRLKQMTGNITRLTCTQIPFKYLKVCFCVLHMHFDDNTNFHENSTLCNINTSIHLRSHVS